MPDGEYRVVELLEFVKFLRGNAVSVGSDTSTIYLISGFTGASFDTVNRLFNDVFEIRK